jgi:cyclic pyranopterin phosphate synthase
MPPEGVPWKEHADLLTFEEMERFAAAAVAEGISKIRLTGGEPLVRKGIVGHIERLRALTGIEAIALTTNATLLTSMAADLHAAGLSRVNVSLDSLDPAVYAQVTRGGRLSDALAGLDAAFRAGMSPIKMNVVVVRSLDQDLVSFARLTLERPIHVRFIEYMPVGGDSEPTPGGACASDSSTPSPAAAGARPITSRAMRSWRGSSSKVPPRDSECSSPCPRTMLPEDGDRRSTSASSEPRARSE